MAASKPRKPQRARTRSNADLGVDECVQMMTSGLWISGQSAAAVAKKHGVSPCIGRQWAATASRIVRAAVSGDLEELRARMVATLETIIAGSVGVEGRTAIAAIDTQAKLLGLVVQKHEVAMTDDECRDLVQRAAKLAK
jgi:hypothetical protein